MRGRPTTRKRTAFGARLVAARTSRGLTQKAVATKMGIERSLVRYYERDAKNPKIESIRRFSNALDVPLEDLLGGKHRPLSKGGPTGELGRLVKSIEKLEPKKRRFVVRLFSSQLPELKRRQS
jgi:transcriptional regulator with XRE-family HTH domain